MTAASTAVTGSPTNCTSTIVSSRRKNRPFLVPTIHVAGETNIHLDAAITSEFANAIYRFGHSMLDENLQRFLEAARKLDDDEHARK